ncbi:syncytin-2-like [Rhineura floridana]|uniref:syncytin-2-like n=1 Tax=Rhineura floridana TaxID=261503 RepID=UPI002AC81FA2|nr:syncytin-2-like [Rhineura floridana]XP_061477876.1 syncytin-2-like [Rhineura floridana]
MNPVLQFRLGTVFSCSLILIVLLCVNFFNQPRSHNEQLRNIRSASIEMDRTNTFVELAHQVSKVFYLKNCWICGSPKGFPEWPWIAFPVAPRWLLSNVSEVHVNLRTWTEPHIWKLHGAGVGKYCIYQNVTGGVQVGNSRCNWTLEWRSYCIIRDCPVTNCTQLASQWNDTHIRLNSGTWCSCIPDARNRSSCRSKCDVPNVDIQVNECQERNLTIPTILKDQGWLWTHLNGTVVKGFHNYWTTWNQTNNYAVCKYKNDSRIWRCSYEERGYRIVTGPLGAEDSYYIPYKEKSPILHNSTRPALKGHYWICGSKAYAILPLNWTGTCYIGVIQPLYTIKGGSFNPLIPVFDEERNDKRKCSINVNLARGQDNGWRDEWPPERIIATYDPASWAQDSMYGYRTPIYLLNRLIRLQAVVEILTNQTANSLILLADQSTQMREGILQNRLALDYLLAKEGGVCGLLNLTECCLKIDDNGEIVKDVANRMKKLAHVPVQTWKGLDLGDWNSCFNWFGGMKTMVILVMLILVGCMLLPCLLPIIMNGIRSIADNAATRSSMQLYGKIMYQRVYKEDPWETKGEKKEEPI